MMEALETASLADDDDDFSRHFHGQLSFEAQGDNRTAMLRGLSNTLCITEV